jgi:glyoxylase-like metal-dependent hydrolase (beta-lactamase superfamily II)
MMQRERVTEDVYIFISDLYVQVTAGIVITSEGVVLLDTLLYPEETLQLRQFIDNRIKMPVRYVINTHHHADHTMGTCFFPEAQIISHRLCRQFLDTRGRQSLQRFKENAHDMDNIQIVLPQIVFDDHLVMQIGNKTFHMEHTPGHSEDSVIVWVEQDNVLFAADTVMSLPYFVDGDYDQFVNSLNRLQGRTYENIVQGHGEVILRGEVDHKLKSDLDYLFRLRSAVDKALAASQDPVRIKKALSSIRISACGKSSILLNGAVEHLHQQNVFALAEVRSDLAFLHTK